MNKQNLLVLGIILVLIAAVAVLAFVIPQQRTLSDDAPSLNADPPAPDAEAAQAYLVASVQGMLYEPIPLTEEVSYTIKQGEDVANVVHVTADSIWMESSTCDNQDCVLQGTVSLDNMGTRVLANMIVCLPNQVVLELHTPETLSSVLALQE